MKSSGSRPMKTWKAKSGVRVDTVMLRVRRHFDDKVTLRELGFARLRGLALGPDDSSHSRRQA